MKTLPFSPPKFLKVVTGGWGRERCIWLGILLLSVFSVLMLSIGGYLFHRNVLFPETSSQFVFESSVLSRQEIQEVTQLLDERARRFQEYLSRP